MLSWRNSPRYALVNDIEDCLQNEVYIVSTNESAVQLGPGRIETLLEKHDQSVESRYLVRNEAGSTCLLWSERSLCQAKRTSWTKNEAVQFLARHFENTKALNTTFLFTSSGEKAEESTCTIVHVLDLSSTGAASIVLSNDEEDAIAKAQDLTARSRSLWLDGSQKSSRLAFVIPLLILAVFSLFLVLKTLHSSSSPLETYQRYDTTGSDGPRYQLQFSYLNVSDWAASHLHSGDDWFLRIDDQAIIPRGLVDEEELHYQAWYQARYPEMNQIRLNHDYLKEEFLGNPEAIQVPADKAFHMSHCVRAVRRYWQARETGKHVCARDIDHRHMKHCLDALDMWAFPEGPRGSFSEMSNKMASETKDTTHLVWKTKVCFDK